MVAIAATIMMRLAEPIQATVAAMGALPVLKVGVALVVIQEQVAQEVARLLRALVVVAAVDARLHSEVVAELEFLVKGQMGLLAQRHRAVAGALEANLVRGIAAGAIGGVACMAGALAVHLLALTPGVKVVTAQSALSGPAQPAHSHPLMSVRRKE